jgi:medium-chain acyl-[acyl-carrier-protein] hydrolase
MPPAAAPTNPWLPFHQPRPHARVRVFCLPYAGGGASVFRGWNEALQKDVELVALQPPGRERRILEPPFKKLPALLDALEPVLAPLLDKPFVLFGYSMGTRIALALAQRWQARGAPLPVGMVLAASNAPHLTRESREVLDEAAFIEMLRRYEGTPAEVFAHKELLDMVVPMLRADFAIADTVLPALPVSCPFSIYGGLEDNHALPETLEGWRPLTTGDFQMKTFPGKHFFLRTARESLLATLRADLARWCPQLGA